MENLQKRYSLHIHSKYSFDSLMEPKKILLLAKKRGIECISITDHNTMKAYKNRDWMKVPNVEVIPGMEINTNMGDLVALQIQEEIKSRNFEEVIDEIHSQGGIAILPHPYKGHKNVSDIAKKVDAIEIWNGHCNPNLNQKALELALLLGKPQVVGSDAHTYSEIGNAVMVCDSLLDSTKTFFVRYPSRIEIEKSNIIGHLKRGRVWNIPLCVVRLLKTPWRRRGERI